MASKQKMKCLMKQTAGPGYDMIDMDIPTPQNGELLVKMKKSSICGSDIALYNWNESKFILKNL